MAHLLTRDIAKAALHSLDSSVTDAARCAALGALPCFHEKAGFNTQGLGCEFMAQGRRDQHRREDQVEDSRAVDFARLQHLGMCVLYARGLIQQCRSCNQYNLSHCMWQHRTGTWQALSAFTSQHQAQRCAAVLQPIQLLQSILCSPPQRFKVQIAGLARFRMINRLQVAVHTGCRFT